MTSVNLLTDLIPVTSNFEMARDEREYQSKFNAVTQTSGNPTGMWEVELKFENIRRADAAKLIARLWGLRGAAGRFRIFDWSAQYADGKGGTYQIEDAASALPGVVKIGNALPNTKLAMAGNYVSINGELKGLIADVVSDHLGKATLVFEPWTRQPVTNGDPVTFDKPTGVFKLKPGYKPPRKTSKTLVLAELTIPCVEVIEQ